jgi:hypothetical protein
VLPPQRQPTCNGGDPVPVSHDMEGETEVGGEHQQLTMHLLVKAARSKLPEEGRPSAPEGVWWRTAVAQPRHRHWGTVKARLGCAGGRGCRNKTAGATNLARGCSKGAAHGDGWPRP